MPKRSNDTDDKPMKNGARPDTSDAQPTWHNMKQVVVTFKMSACGIVLTATVDHGTTPTIDIPLTFKRLDDTSYSSEFSAFKRVVLGSGTELAFFHDFSFDITVDRTPASPTRFEAIFYPRMAIVTNKVAVQVVFKLQVLDPIRYKPGDNPVDITLFTLRSSNCDEDTTVETAPWSDEAHLDPYMNSVDVPRAVILELQKHMRLPSL